jgi:hypothetical protein
MWRFKLPNFYKRKDFSPALSEEVARLKSAIARAEREGLDPQFESEVHSSQVKVVKHLSRVRLG